MKALMIFLPLATFWGGCCPTAPPVSPVPVAGGVDTGRDEDRDPLDVIRHARHAIIDHHFERALRDLLWAFDRGPEVKITAIGVIVTSVPDLLAEMGKMYPPALAALRERKSRIEVALRTGQPVPNHEVGLYEASARALGQVDDAVKTCRMMAKVGEAARPRRILCSGLVDELLDAGMWEEAVERAEDLFGRFGTIAHRREAELRNPRTPDFTPEVARQGARLFGAMLRLNRKEQALDFAQRLLGELPKAITYDEMIDAAREAGHEELARQLAQQASSKLDKAELQRLKQPRP